MTTHEQACQQMCQHLVGPTTKVSADGCMGLTLT